LHPFRVICYEKAVTFFEKKVTKKTFAPGGAAKPVPIKSAGRWASSAQVSARSPSQRFFGASFQKRTSSFT
jgi:hypothetical protein